MFSLDGQAAFVTGAGQGLGAAIALGLAQAGAGVMLTDVDAAAAEAVAAGLRDAGHRCIAMALDVRDESAFERSFEAAVQHFGAIDLMVNNAALTPSTSLWDITAGEWDEVMAVNLRGSFFGCRIAGRHMRERGEGRIVNLGSMAGIWSYPSGSSYVASKFAVHGYTRALRDDLQGKPVRVTNVAPGLVETNFSKVRFKGDEDKASAVYSDVAMGGPMHAEDVADCIMFALTRPPHVNVDEIVVMALAQISGANILRES